MPARRRRGICPTCGRNIAVTWETGQVWRHGPPDQLCKGVGQPPAALNGGEQ